MQMQFQFLGIDHVQLAAPEGFELAARAFFSGLLGWEEIETPPVLRHLGGLWFRCGNRQVHIGKQKDFVPAEKAHPAFEVKNVAALRMYLEGKGFLTIDAEPLESISRFHMADPFGNRLEFVEHLKTGNMHTSRW